MSDKNIGSLEEQAQQRRERLLNLKRKRNDDIDNKLEQIENLLPKPKFRSYKPQDEELGKSLLPMAKPGDVVSEVKDQLELGITQVVIEEVDIPKLVPRKPDWDLKRDAAPKLEKLERRTQKAIAELIRDRLKEEQQKSII